jgi:hypothetical protein
VNESNKKYTNPFETRDIFHISIIQPPPLLPNKNT